MSSFAQAAASEEGAASETLRTAQVDLNAGGNAHILMARLGSCPFAVVLVFLSPEADFDGFIREAHAALPDTCIVGCTTAGEIGKAGYEENQAVAIGLPKRNFAVQAEIIPNLSLLDLNATTDRVIEARVRQATEHSDLEESFAFLLVDGLSRREDVLVAAITRGLGRVPLFGGSAADGTRFGCTKVALGEDIRSDAAVLCLIRTRCRTQVFTLDHLLPGDQRMVVTGADPERRIVKTINAEPAAREYARIVGKDPNQLSAFTFAENPVVVRIGGSHHVRAIQQVNGAGELVFFSAIDEGMVLTVAEASDLPSHLDRELSALSEQGAPDAIIGCDCILRRIEAEQSQATGQVSAVLARHNVVGFSTYGEQFGPLHVNHTMTGVAIYPPEIP